ncbi:MAG TPA: hypothetical protein PKZ07_16910 [Sedimentisphaerales bacterium]|nr:hypothetical protein [Sedimentisphaerales bacterium]
MVPVIVVGDAGGPTENANDNGDLSRLARQMLAADLQFDPDPDPYIRIDRLSPRVALAYWPGIDRRCNLTVIQSQKGLVIVDTEASPRVMAPMKRKIEQAFGRTDWAYVINTHPHGHGHQDRNVKNLWRILDEEDQSSFKPGPAKP